MMFRATAVVAGFAIVAAGVAAVTGAAPPAFEGKAVVYGKSYTPKYAWMVRGASKLSPEKVETYVILSADDVSEKIRKCEDVTCAVWDAVTTGLVLQADASGFWVLVLDPERKPSQHSGAPTHWTETTHTPNRVAGRLLWKPDNGNPMFDFQVDATLLKEWKTPAK